MTDTIEQIRKCSTCEVKKPLTDFNNDNKCCKICLQKQKEYYERNKEYKKEYGKEYRQWRYECPYCKVMVTFHHKARHERTKKHLKHMNIVNETEQ